MKTLTLKLPEILEIQLNDFSRKIGLSRSEIVRRALKEYLRRDKKSDSSSFLDLTRDLAGSIDGPPDLTTNIAHFEGYGK